MSSTPQSAGSRMGPVSQDDGDSVATCPAGTKAVNGGFVSDVFAYRPAVRGWQNVHLSHAFTTLGDTRLAHVSQERALELSAPTSTMTRTLLKIDAATCSHHDGDTEQACRRTVGALTALLADYRTGLVRRRALDQYEAIPAQHHHERAVQELRDVVAG
ncbi:hypothetical protein ABZ567_32005 [Streptomyces sp. NPDC016459]|uniref:hypothetical protein n=1 Tax=Streptomyces sp. NPDC016459 TaxID=3157190 RepID=UPI00340D2F53